MIICCDCGKIITYSGELSDAALSMLGMTRADAALDEHPDRLCNECVYAREDAIVDELVSIVSD